MAGENSRLNHEDLDVYQAAIEFLAIAALVAEEIPRGYSFLNDQRRRAALFVPLNIAEGYGKRSQADRARYYDNARGSAHECAAILDSQRQTDGLLVMDRRHGSPETVGENPRIE